jgi:hypothetical protein
MKVFAEARNVLAGDKSQKPSPSASRVSDPHERGTLADRSWDGDARFTRESKGAYAAATYGFPSGRPRVRGPSSAFSVSHRRAAFSSMRRFANVALAWRFTGSPEGRGYILATSEGQERLGHLPPVVDHHP